jgi:uncharacterized protein YydD (DUF2326 family)
MTISAWSDLLGRTMFGLPAVSTLGAGEFLSFRNCVSYFARRQRSDGYFNWRRHFGQQPPVAWQATLAFLFGLDRQGVLALHRVKEAEKEKAHLERFLRSELAEIAIPSTAKLRTASRKLRRQLDKLELQVSNFQIVDYYDDLVDNANELQSTIDELTRANLLDGELIHDIKAAMETEVAPALPDLKLLYEEAGIVLPDVSLRRYQEVEAFHTSVVANRREHLTAELVDATARTERRAKRIAALSEKRNTIVQTLDSGGALSHYRKLDAQFVSTRSEYETITRQLELSERLSLMKSDLKVERAEAERRIRQDIVERESVVENIASTFEDISEQLYDNPSSLEVRATKDGLDFHVESPEIASEGVNRVQIFTFDLTLATICAKRGAWPGFLIHDSHIFDGVDGRQIASALKAAHEGTTALGGQYIVTMNSDDLEKAERESGQKFDHFVVQPELDDSPTGSLFGFRFATLDTGEKEPSPTT